MILMSIPCHISYWLFHQNFIEWPVHVIWTISYGSYWLFNGFFDQLYFPSFFIDLWNIELMIYVKSYIEFISYELYNLSFVEISLLFDINNCLLTIVCWWSYAGDRMLAIVCWRSCDEVCRWRTKFYAYFRTLFYAIMLYFGVIYKNLSVPRVIKIILRSESMKSHLIAGLIRGSLRT